MFDIRDYIVEEKTKYRSRLNRLTKDPESFFESGFNKTDYNNYLNYFTVKAAQESIGLNKSFTPNLSAIDDLIDNRDEYIKKYGKAGYNSIYSARLSQAKGDIENINKAMKWKGSKLTADVLNSSAWLKDRYVYDPENPEDMMAQSLGYAPAALDQKTAKAIIAEAKRILKAKTKSEHNALQDHYPPGFSLALLDEIAPGNRPATEAEIKEAMNVINEAYGLNSYLTPEQQQQKIHGLVPLPGTGKPGIRVTLPYREPKDKGRFSAQEPMRIQLTGGQPGLNDNGGDEKGQDDKRDPFTEDHVYITEDEYNSYLDVLKDEYNTYYSETDEYGNLKPKATSEDFNKKKEKLEENWEWSKEQGNATNTKSILIPVPGVELTNTKTGEKVTSEDIDFDTAMNFLYTPEELRDKKVKEFIKNAQAIGMVDPSIDVESLTPEEVRQTAQDAISTVNFIMTGLPDSIYANDMMTQTLLEQKSQLDENDLDYKKKQSDIDVRLKVLRDNRDYLASHRGIEYGSPVTDTEIEVAEKQLEDLKTPKWNEDYDWKQGWLDQFSPMKNKETKDMVAENRNAISKQDAYVKYLKDTKAHDDWLIYLDEPEYAEYQNKLKELESNPYEYLVFVFSMSNIEKDKEWGKKNGYVTEGNLMGGLPNLSYLAPEESEVYNYLKYKDKKDGTDFQYKFLDYIHPIIRERIQNEWDKALYSVSKKRPIESSIASILFSPFTAAGAAYNAGATILGQEVNPSDSVFAPIRDIQTMRGAVSEDMSGLGKFLYNTGMSAGDMAVLMPLGETGMLFIMSNEAASQQTYNVLANGGTQKQALFEGVLYGMTAYMTEKLPLHNLFNIGKFAAGKSAREVAVLLLEQGGVNAGEEIIEGLSNLIEDQIVLGSKSPLNLRVQELRNKGKSESEAQSQALWEAMGDVALQGASGFIDSMFLGGGALITSNINSNVQPDQAIDNNEGNMLQYKAEDDPDFLKKVDSLNRFATDNEVDDLRLSTEEILKQSGGRTDLAESLILATKEIVPGKTVPELVGMFNIPDKPAPGSLSTYKARIWYLYQESLIKSSLNYSKPLEQVARDAVNLRNQIRTQAREYMSDRAWAEYLKENDKNKTFEQQVSKYSKLGFTGDALWKIIIESSMKSRGAINQIFNLEIGE